MVYAIIWKGKGRNSADWFKPMQFESRDELDAFKAKTDAPDEKYWTVVREFSFDDEEDDIPYNNYDGSII